MEEKKKEKSDEEEKDEEEDSLVENQNLKDIANHNHILGGVLIFVGVVLALIIGMVVFSQATNNFNHEGFDFDVLKEGNVKFYHTSFTIYNAQKKIDYNVYLRTDPRELEQIPFEGDFNRQEMMVLNTTHEFNCDGDGVIAVANMAQVLEALGTKIITDPEASCDEEGRYTYTNILPGNETKVEKFGPSCYNIYVNKCEIIKGTERFTLEFLKDF